MRQFLAGNNTMFRDLEERARYGCIRFRALELPPGCDPNRADIGFEVDAESGAAKLLIKRGVRYGGENRAVGDWLQAGEKPFASFLDLTNWIQSVLTLAGGPRIPLQTQVEGNGAPLTDMDAVRQGIRDIHQPLYLDQDVFFNQLRQDVRGQDEALKGIAAVISRHLARRQPARPAVIFAVGPSGVGKTRTAELTAKALGECSNENNDYRFLRLDMTEYQEAHRVSQLIGAPQGYVGHGDGSQLVDALRANPRTIVLFDEIEKAHPAILRVLMNAMDAGRLSTASSSPQGREIDCRHAVFMFTSNLDAKEILDELEHRTAFGNQAVEDEVCRRRLHTGGIAPEIVGRIGRFLVFRPLSPEIRAEIMTISIAEVAEEYGLRVSYVEPEIIVNLVQSIRSQSFGVRPERFLIDSLLGEAFAKATKQGVNTPVIVAGPPYECRAAVSGDLRGEKPLP